MGTVLEEESASVRMNKQAISVLSGEQVLNQLHTSLAGLSQSEVETHRVTFGLNVLKKSKRPWTFWAGN